MNRSKRLIAKLWKLIPDRLRWRAIWALSPRFIVGVSGIVIDEREQVLLAHHVFRGEHAWAPPGGIVNYGEGLPEALQREILEETRLQVEVGPLLQVGFGDKWPHLTFFFLCTVPGTPQPEINGELFEAGFYPPDALPSTLEPVQEGALDYALQLYRHPGTPAETRIVEAEAP